MYMAICVIIMKYNTLIYNTFCPGVGNMPGTEQDLIKIRL